MSNRSTFSFFFFTVTNPLFHILQKSFGLNWQYPQFWTAVMRLYRSAFLPFFLSFSPFLFFFLQKEEKKSMLFFMLLSALWLELHSTFSTAAPSPLLNRPSLHPCSILVSPDLQNSHQGNLQSLLNIHNTNLSLRSGSFINLHIPPFAPLLRFLLEWSTTDLKAKLHLSTHLL